MAPVFGRRPVERSDYISTHNTFRRGDWLYETNKGNNQNASPNDFVRSEGCLILETNSVPGEGEAGNSGYNALGLGDRILGDDGGSGFSQDVISATTYGPLRDLRGLDVATTFSRNLNSTGHTLVGVSGGSSNSMVEFRVGDGMVLGVGDPYGFKWFDNRFSKNLNAYLNFIENCAPVSRTPVLEAQIEIKPGKNPNSINCKKDRE